MARRPSPRRAPRLGPDELIAPHITRLGRFRKRDPRKAKALPGCARMIGVVVWAGFIAEMLRRARRQVRAADAPAGEHKATDG